jgi:hypothetical protein
MRNARRYAESFGYDRLDFERDVRDSHLDALKKKWENDEPMSLWEVCAVECNSTDLRKVNEYLNRHYGHG